MYNGNRELIERLVDILSPGDSLFGRILRPIWSSISGIQRMAFIATKADLFRKDDRSKLEDLVRQMTKGFVERLIYQRSNLDCRYLACSAVLSTEALPDGHVRGLDIRNGLSLLDMEPPRVPDTWPVAWKVGDYRFRGVSPQFPENTSIPPQHLKMDTLMDYLFKPI
jgi:predicted YcjX-like family ATPase